MAHDGHSVKRVRLLVVSLLLLALVGVASPAAGSSAVRPQGSASAAVQVPGGRPVPATGTGGATAIDWAPCGRANPGYDCATVTVPLDYDRPSRGTTQLALTRWPAADADKRIGSVFVNPGGPGQSGVGYVLNGFGELLGRQLEGRFDIVGFDPRGVGASEPLHCFDSEAEVMAFWSSQPAFPYRKDQYRPFFEAFAGLGAECLDDDQRIAEHMNTADVARDLDQLRQATGDRQLTYIGFSYGSYLGTTYANMFPDTVRALVIDGVLDPRLWSSGWQIKSDRTATQEVLDEFLRLCDAAKTECAFWTPEGSAQRWDRLSDAVRREPITLPDGSLYTYDALIADAASASYVPEFWGGDGGAAALLDVLADAALAGDQSAAAQAARLRGELMERLTAGADEAAYPNDFDAYYGNQCADTQYPAAFREWLDIDRYARHGSEFGPYWWWNSSGCADWPVNDDRYLGPWTARTSSPVLVVGNYFDGVTDYAGAVATDRLLGSSRLLSYAGWGHTAYGRSQCVADHVDTYLLTGSLPPQGTVCPANPNPFLPEAAREDQLIPQVGLPSPWAARPDLPVNRSSTGTP
jgi:pimeloyl-ACP methyl ester carboxylesterase